MSAEVAAAIKRLFDILDVDPPRMSWKNAWASAARELGRTISPTEYDSAVLALVQERFLAARGAGAQTPLVRRAAGPPVTPERDLMPGVEEWLREVWLPGSALPSAEIIDRIVEDTSRARERGAGPNSQPDFLAMFLCERRTKLLTRYLDVASFEVKAANASIPAAAQQAQNHHNFVNRSYLIWPASNDEVDLIDDLTRACTARRIGLIAFSDASDPGSFRIILESTRHEPDAVLVEEFISARIAPHIQARMFGAHRNDG